MKKPDQSDPKYWICVNEHTEYGAGYKFNQFLFDQDMKEHIDISKQTDNESQEKHTKRTE